MSKTIERTSVFANCVFGVLTLYFAYNSNQLSSKIANLEANQFTYEALLKDSTLVLAGKGSTFLEPSHLRVIPHFDTGSAILEEGHSFPIPISGGEILLQDREIVFRNILEAVCEFPQNFDLCSDGIIAQLEVSLIVNGNPDTDIVIIPGT